MKEKNQ
jgi:hypothetical protein